MVDYTLGLNVKDHHWGLISNDDSSVSLSGALQTAGRTGNRLTINLVFDRGGANLRKLLGEFAHFQGRRNRIIVPLSRLNYQIGGSVGGTPLLDGAHSAGATNIAIKGLPSNTSGILDAGDFLQIGNQLVMAAEDLDSTGTTGTLDVWPEIHKALADNTAIDYTTSASLYGHVMSEINFGSPPWSSYWFSTVSMDIIQDVLA